MNSHIKQMRKKTLPILKDSDVTHASFFGSFVRGENTKTSDIDILVEFKGEKSLLDLVDLKIRLEKELKMPVDLLTYHSLSPFLKHIILKEEVQIL